MVTPSRLRPDILVAMGRALPLVLALAGVLSGGCHLVAGYDGYEFGDLPPGDTSITQLGGAISRIDLLLVIDNSRSMADKQEVLGTAVPDLVDRLVNPRCVDVAGQQVVDQPESSFAPCPDGATREFEPMTDIHIGIITSSIGGHGADLCSASSIPSENDKAHLISRSADRAGSPIATYDDLGFLAWDPLGVLQPNGESNSDKLISDVRAIVLGAGEKGCGYEATLDSWYRFLIEPDPYDAIELDGSGSVVLEGTDDTLLQQRKAFLRPDSLLAIIMLSDENDCSIRDEAGEQYYYAAQSYVPGTTTPYQLPKPRAACASDPNDPCCRSCGELPAEGCDTSNDDCDPISLPALEDNANLRCWDQKRRFGIDFLWPISRYVEGLTQSSVADRYGNVVANPLFSDLDPDDDNNVVRRPSAVFLTGIVGVPWQDIARQTDGVPDVESGLNEFGQVAGGFQSATQLADNGTWDIILGDPSCYHTDPSCLPRDPLMIEDFQARSGANPVTNDALAPPGSGELANPINGSEYTIALQDDLQYACIFPLDTSRDCEGATSVCDCADPTNDNPLCVDNSITGSGHPTEQKYAKAYPGVRQLQVLKALASQGIVASICPRQLHDDGPGDYGYRPAVDGLIETIKQPLGTRFCLDETLVVADDGSTGCVVIEARQTQVGACDCDSQPRYTLDESQLAMVQFIQSEQPQFNCFCGVREADGSDLTACQLEEQAPVVNDFGYLVHGWCYVDTAASPAVGSDVFTNSCEFQRVLRFVGDARPVGDGMLYLLCE